ncbi:MAG: transposase, partial [Candidatus Eremiobacteraeota bacterium]|nr:transposase [Candidatus Eremiobacteraeota bacterium]
MMNQPEFPATFANLQEARAFCRIFFEWYNTQHRHSSLALLTPADVHHGFAPAHLAQGQRTLLNHFATRTNVTLDNQTHVRLSLIAPHTN